jgi:phage/plasmid-like protein (TIGR03299 family)
MSHELTLRADGKTEMAFTGDTPWHGLGQNVTKGASIGVWLKEAGMDWEARTAAPIYTPVVGRTTEQGGERYVKAQSPRVVEDSKIIYRGDTGAPLSIVGRDYKIVQPKQVLEFFREEVESGGWYIHTAGTMRGGRKLWAMATCEDSKRYVKGKQDLMVRNLLCATSLDGSMRTTVALTDVRVVCANTLRAALDSVYGARAADRVEISHRSIFNPQAIKKVLGVAMDSYETFMASVRELSETPIDLTEAEEVLEQIFKPEKKEQNIDLSWMGNLADLGKPVEAEPTQARSISRILALFDGEGMGANLKTAKGTRWGLLNAVTQYVDHEMGRTPDTRLDSAWFGRGAGLKTQTYELLAKV